ncbi:hypothetical protein GCM10018777_40050 [Streptomyces albogriseolus]|nr:hypothetical protein GCM10018777_40050 [Streptomyces viridodiastaticus]
MDHAGADRGDRVLAVEHRVAVADAPGRDRAAVQAEGAGDGAQQRGLAGAVRAEQGDDRGGGTVRDTERRADSARP